MYAFITAASSAALAIMLMRSVMQHSMDMALAIFFMSFFLYLIPLIEIGVKKSFDPIMSAVPPALYQIGYAITSV